MARKRRRKLKKSVKIAIAVFIILVTAATWLYVQVDRSRDYVEPVGDIKSGSTSSPVAQDVTEDPEEVVEETLLTYTVKDVGAGEAILVETGETTALIDTGSKKKGRGLANDIANAGTGELDYLVLTSGDKGRIGGLKDIAEGLTVKNVVVGEIGKYKKDVEKYFPDANIMGGTNLNIDLGSSVTLNIYQPKSQSDDIDDKSLITTVTYKGYVFYAGSEAGKAEEKKMLNELDGTTVYVASQRGQGDTNYILNALSTDYVVISKSKKELIYEKFFNRLGSTTYATSDCGDIKFVITTEEFYLEDEELYLEEGLNLVE